MLKRVVWSWKCGSVTSELYYLSGTKRVYHLDNPPPTSPAHDISHFICGFHSNMEWDFSLEPNHIAEYNAVFMEHLLLLFYKYPDISGIPLNRYLDGIKNHMSWFTYHYYKIPQTLGSKYTDCYLLDNFLQNLNPQIASKFYSKYYSAAYLVEDLKLNQDQINIQLTLDQSSDIIDQKCLEFISKIKSLNV